FLFFVSSRRRHTRFSRDWSSDVCSSDLFRAREYETAQGLFTQLSADYPGSATSLVWLGDAVLFDRARETQAAALDALPSYARAGQLHDAGCKLPRRPRYYHLMGEAYAYLRLAARDHGFDSARLDQALRVLATAAGEFPTSAEVPYTEARAHCALAQTPAGQTNPGPSAPPEPNARERP